MDPISSILFASTVIFNNLYHRIPLVSKLCYKIFGFQSININKTLLEPQTPQKPYYQTFGELDEEYESYWLI